MTLKRVLVTGASKGIGKAIAIRLAKDGYQLAIHYNRDKAGIEDTAAEIRKFNIEPVIMQFDVCEREKIRAMLEKDMEINGVYFGVVANAGITKDNAFPSMTGEDWDAVIQTNLGGFYNVVQPIVMPMVRSRAKGRIVTISSISGIIGNRGQVNYSATKAGLIGATKSLALELAKREITVNCIAPGIITTEMTNSIPEEVKQTIPMRRYGLPEEVAGVASFLFSDDASYVTRQVISVNGGLI
jgi:3-oxoacyl-[acyl-carrier protein] reductase